MASPVITPTPVVPATPAPVTPAAPTPVTEHSRVDAVQNRIAARLANARPGQAAPVAPAPVVIPDPAIPAVPASAVPGQPSVPAPAQPATATPASTPTDQPAPAVVDAPTEIDLADIDFDKPLPVETAPAAPAPGQPAAAQPEPTRDELAKDLRDLLGQEDADKVLGKVLTIPRGRRMLEANRVRQELEKPPAEGGLGRFPTVEEIREADSAARSVMLMRADYENDPLSFVNNVFVANPETGRTFLGDAAKASTILEAIPQALYQAAQSGSQVHAQMLAAYSGPLFSRFFDHQYTEAFSMPEETQGQIAQYQAAKQDPPLLADKIRVLDALQIAEYKAFGKARPMSWSPGQPATTVNPGAADPEKAQLIERLRQQDEMIRQGRQTQLTSMLNQIETGGKTTAMNDVDFVLKHAGVDKVYPQSILQSQQNDIYNQVKDQLPALDPSGWQRYQLQLKDATNGRMDASVPQKTFRMLFQNALRNSPLVRERINDLVKGAKSNVDAQHQNRQQSQLRTEPNGGGIPAPASVVTGQQIARQSGESIEDYNTRRILAARQRSMQQPAR